MAADPSPAAHWVNQIRPGAIWLAGPSLGFVITLAVAEIGILRVLRGVGWVLRPRSWLERAPSGTFSPGARCTCSGLILEGYL